MTVDVFPPSFPIPMRLMSTPLTSKTRLDAALWTEASQGSDLTQRLPVKIAPASTRNSTATYQNQACLESVAFLKRVVQHPSKYYIDGESADATVQPASIVSEAGKPTSSPGDFSMDHGNDIVGSQLDPVAAEVMQECAESDDSQRTESNASSDKEQLMEEKGSEAAEQHLLPRHSCDYCDYRTPKKYRLVEHVRTHTGSKPYRCEKCGYRSAQKGQMTVHLRIHSGEKPYQCEHCDFRTGSRSCLNVHKRKHADVKPHACPLCAFRTAYKWNLDAHLRAHTGDKPYKCSHCEYRTTQSGNLNLHVRRMH